MSGLIIVLLAFLFVISVAALLSFFKITVPSNPSDIVERQRHKEKINAMNRQTAALEERNYYERGDSIYSSRRLD